jgi:hypothetical protein
VNPRGRLGFLDNSHTSVVEPERHLPPPSQRERLWPESISLGSFLLHGPLLEANTANRVDDFRKHIAAPDTFSLAVLEKATGPLEPIPSSSRWTWPRPVIFGFACLCTE